jgi:hypothetical protein
VLHWLVFWRVCAGALERYDIDRCSHQFRLSCSTVSDYITDFPVFIRKYGASYDPMTFKHISDANSIQLYVDK